MTPSTPTRKTWHRPRNVLLVLGLLALAWTVRQAWWWATAEPAPVVDYASALHDLTASHQPDGRDGWEFFRDAASGAEEVEASVVALDLADKTSRPRRDHPYLDYSLVLRKTLDREFLAPELLALERLRDRGIWDLLAEGAACPRAIRPSRAGSPIVTDFFLPEIRSFRSLASARVASMRLAAIVGDRDERVAAFEQSLALARVSASQPTLIEHLVGLAIADLALEELRVELHEAPVDEGTGRRLLGAMDRQLRLPPMSMVVEAERMMMLDMIQCAFTDDGHGDGRLDATALNDIGGSAPITARLGGLFLAGRKETTALANELYDGLAHNADLDPARRATNGFDEGAFMSQLNYRHVLLKALAPAVARSLASSDRVRGQVAATRIMVAVETYRAIHGEPPDRLEDLVPEVLAEVPADPANGAAFLYRRGEAHEHGRDYVLCSMGLAATDDAGGARAEQDPLRAGVDVLAVEPRRDEDAE
jgi:hypothetical protein